MWSLKGASNQLFLLLRSQPQNIPFCSIQSIWGNRIKKNCRKKSINCTVLIDNQQILRKEFLFDYNIGRKIQGFALNLNGSLNIQGFALKQFCFPFFKIFLHAKSKLKHMHLASINARFGLKSWRA